MRVLLLTQWFDPEPTFKGLVFARELLRQGFEVEVVTGFPNYPGGKLYPGYKIRLLQRELVDGVHVTRVPLYPSHNQSGVGRILNYVTFAAAAFVYGVFWAKKPDVIYAYHPPLTVGIAAVGIKIFRSAPVVYDIQDMWPDTLLVTGMVNNAGVLSVLAWICSVVYRRVDHIVVLSPGFKKLLIARGVPSQKLDVIYNWCDEAALGNTPGYLPEGFPDKDRFTIVFAGNMGKAQALEAVLDAAEIIQKKESKVSFVFIGGGVEVDRLKGLAKEKQLTNVVFCPAVPMSEIGGVLSKADALLVHLRKDPLFTITIPSKIQAYMAVGKPLLMAVDGDAADLVRTAGCGVVAESENPDSLADAVCSLYAMSSSQRESMGSLGRHYYQSHLALRAGVGRFGEIFNKLGNKRVH